MDWRDAEREYTDEVIKENTIPRMFEESAERYADRPAQMYKGGVYERSLEGVISSPLDGEFTALTYSEMRDIVHNLT
ncbi:MAG: long-chain fatty acid--CoA ligase, partial [Halobacteria archaeon]|nr:long-chain fatty acid--CoA ligase [Halobacteria archaeon]